MMTFNHHLPKEVDFIVWTKLLVLFQNIQKVTTAAHRKLSLLRQNTCMLCNITSCTTPVMLLLQRPWEMVYNKHKVHVTFALVASYSCSRGVAQTQVQLRPCVSMCVCVCVCVCVCMCVPDQTRQ